jgi:hypothetical protein
VGCRGRLNLSRRLPTMSLGRGCGHLSPPLPFGQPQGPNAGPRLTKDFRDRSNSAASPVGLTLPKRNGGLRGQEPSNPCQVGRELLGSGGEPCLAPRGVITSGPAPEKRSSSVSANKFRHVTDDGRAVTAVVLGGAVRVQEISWTPCLYHLDRGPSGSRVSVVAAALKQGEERASSPEHNPGHVH